MARYIDADVLKRFRDDVISGKLDIHNEGDLIDLCPAADVAEAKHGYWATDEEDIKWGNALKRKHCSVCQKRPLFDKGEREFVLTKFCPKCGAKMDGGAK